MGQKKRSEQKQGNKKTEEVSGGDKTGHSKRQNQG